MKSIKYLITVLFLLILSQGFLQAQSFGEWQWQNPTLHSNEIQSIFFINENLGWVVGNGGLVKSTEDGGETWTLHSLGDLNTFYDVFFFDENHGWIVGNANRVYHTNDGGITWGKQEFDIASTQSNSIRSVTFTDANTGYAVGWGRTLQRTNDGGQTWESFRDDFATSHYDAVFFLDQDTGFIVGRRQSSSSTHDIYKTSDGGENWEYTEMFAHNVRFWDIAFANDEVGVLVGDQIRRTADGGESWSTVDNDSPRLFSITFLNDEVGYAAGRRSVMKTEDGGESWTELDGYDNITFNHVAVNSDNIWIGGEDGVLMYTSNDENWENYNQYNREFTSSFNAVYFTEPETAWLLASSSLYKTEDAGNTILPEHEFENWYRDLFFLDNQHGWLVGSSGNVKYSTDGGDTWIAGDSNTGERLDAVYFVTPNLGWASGNNGTIIHTEDGGATWEEQSSGTSEPLHDIHFVSDLKGWAVGGSGSNNSTIRHTNDGGDTWINQNITPNWSLESVYFVNDSTGFAAGNRGTFLRTNDSGQNWQWIDLSVGRIQDMHFFDNMNGWAVTRESISGDGYLMYTGNGGSNWQIAMVSSGNNLSSVHFSETGNGLASGASGTLLRFIPSDSPLTVNLHKPFNNAQNVPVQPELEWARSFDAESYQIQLSQDSEFSSALIDSSGITGNSFVPENDLESEVAYYWRVRSENSGVNSEWSNVYSFTTELSTSSEPVTGLPREFSLEQNYPNPFNPSTVIEFSLPQTSNVRLEVFNVVGQRVSTLVNETRQAGVHQVNFNASQLASGVYFYRISAGNFVQTRQLTLIK